MKPINLSEVQEASEGVRLPAGGYIAQIITVEDVPSKEYLKMTYDIAYGEHKGYFAELFDRVQGKFWAGILIKSYKEKALPFLKGFLTAIEKSNKGFVVPEPFSNEQILVGKYVGLVLAEEEYVRNDEKIGTRLYVAEVHGAEKIKNNEYTVPELKKLANSNTPAVTNPNVGNSMGTIISDDDLPF